jgi:hypothetical protein
MPRSKISKRRISRQPYKSLSSRNSKSLRRTLTKKVNLSIKNLESQMKAQIKVREFALQSENLEMIAYSNKIIMIMLLQLIVEGSKKALQVANEYSDKTGIKLDEASLKRQLNKLPTVKSTVKKAQNSFHKPTLSTIASPLSSLGPR